MTDELKTLMQVLGNAVNDSLAESDRIAAAIGDIQRAGYDVVLVLEATIGVNERNGENEGAEEEAAQTPSVHEPKPLVDAGGNVTFKLTPNDDTFLRALKIATDKEER